MRVVADHSRATTFLIADGVIPSNEWRGYVLRKIMRRAMRHGKHLGLTEPFLHEMVARARARDGRCLSGTAHQSRDDREDDHGRGEPLRNGAHRRSAASRSRDREGAGGTGDASSPATSAFRLYDTFGVPYDFIEDTAATRDATVDREGFERAMESQRDKARAQSAFGGGKKGAGVRARRRRSGALRRRRSVRGLRSDDRHGRSGAGAVRRVRVSRSTSSPSGSTGFVALARTPFYLEAGGQVSDSGRIVNEATGASAVVEGLVRIRQGLPRAHRVRVETRRAARPRHRHRQVDADVRDATRRNHTATHLLHAALRQVLGTPRQAGRARSSRRIGCVSTSSTSSR